jgi:hypothetical protein
MRGFALLALVLSFIVLVVPVATAEDEPLEKGAWISTPATVPQAKPIPLRRIRALRRQVWRCQNYLGRQRSLHSTYVPYSVAYRRWVWKLWTGRKRACLADRRLFTRLDSSFYTAAPWVGRQMGRSWLSSWFVSCAEDEGGDVSSSRLRVSLVTGGQPGWNRAGSYAFGTLQFMLEAKPAPHPHQWGTFERMIGWARADFPRLIRWVPDRYERVDSVLGQLLAGGAGVLHGRAGEWAGAGC